jgi:hypothetical protein
VFISYRQAEDGWPANLLYEHLRKRFPETKIFKDISSIDLGDDWVTAITAAVESCDVLLAVIGPSWLTLAGRDGGRKLDTPDDWVRIEIETALRRGIGVIPILIDGAEMPSDRQLPSSLVELARKQALQLTARRFRQDVTDLVEVIRKEVAGSADAIPHERVWDLAISYAPQDESLAREIHEQLRDKFDVFYAPAQHAPLWGSDLNGMLPNTYDVQSSYVLILSTQNYVDKYWTRVEYDAVASRAPDRILLLDMGALPANLPPGLVYRGSSPAEMVSLLS